MTSRAWIVLAVALTGCGGIKEAETKQKDLGQQVGDIGSDMHVLRDASAAVNEVIRVQDDCELARPAIPKAQAALDEAEKRVRTVAGRASLDALRAQVRSLSQNCN